MEPVQLSFHAAVHAMFASEAGQKGIMTQKYEIRGRRREYNWLCGAFQVENAHYQSVAAYIQTGDWFSNGCTDSMAVQVTGLHIDKFSYRR